MLPTRKRRRKKKISSIKEERDEMAGNIRYIKFSGDYYKFDEWKEKTKAIARHKGILKYLTNKWDIPKEDDTDILWAAS